jgi:hypothetical protein
MGSVKTPKLAKRHPERYRAFEEYAFTAGNGPVQIPPSSQEVLHVTMNCPVALHEFLINFVMMEGKAGLIPAFAYIRAISRVSVLALFPYLAFVF